MIASQTPWTTNQLEKGTEIKDAFGNRIAFVLDWQDAELIVRLVNSLSQPVPIYNPPKIRHAKAKSVR